MRVYFTLDIDDVKRLRRVAKAIFDDDELPLFVKEHASDFLSLMPGVEAMKAWTPEEILAREG